MFYSGDLAGRLIDANLPTAEPRHVRAIGVAVGQRAARETFNVRIDGVDAAIADPDLERWPPLVGVPAGPLPGPSAEAAARSSARTTTTQEGVCLTDRLTEWLTARTTKPHTAPDGASHTDVRHHRAADSADIAAQETVKGRFRMTPETTSDLLFCLW